MAHDTLLTVFIIIAAAAFVLQALAMFGVYTAMRRIQGDIAGLRADMKERLDSITQSVTGIVSDSREPVRTVMSNLVEVSRVLRDRTGSVDEVLDDLLERFRQQVVRIDQTITDVLEKIDKTTTLVQRNIAAPVSEVSAILKGVQAGMDFFLSRRRPGSAQSSDVPQDEQMFI
jgi:ABC-type transporter Mla subunit MlaD